MLPHTFSTSGPTWPALWVSRFPRSLWVAVCFGGCDDKRRYFLLFPKRFIAVSFYTTSLQTERFSSAVARRCIPRVPTVLEKTSSFVAL